MIDKDLKRNAAIGLKKSLIAALKAEAQKRNLPYSELCRRRLEYNEDRPRLLRAAAHRLRVLAAYDVECTNGCPAFDVCPAARDDADDDALQLCNVDQEMAVVEARLLETWAAIEGGDA